MATVCEHGGVASLIGKVKLLVKNVRLGEAADGAVRAIASGHVDNRSHCFLMFKWSVGKRKNLTIEPSFGILEPFERQHIVLEIILDSVQKLILPNYFELLVETASKEQIEKCNSTIWNNRSLVEVRIPVELTFHDNNVEDNLVKDEKFNHHITVAEIVNGIGKLDIRNDRNKSAKYNEKFSPTYAIISVGFGEPRYKFSSQTDDKYRTENFSSKYIRSIMVVPVDFSEKISETMTSEAFGKSKFSENKTAVNRCNDDGIVENDNYLKFENAVKLDPVSSNMDRETELLETKKLKEMLELFLQEEENFIYSSGKSTNNSENGSIEEEIEASVVRKNAAFQVGNGKQAAVIIGDKKNDDCSFDWTNSNTDTSSLETDMTEAEYECNSSRQVAVEEITVTTDDSENSEEITDTTENEDSEEDTDTTDTENSDSDESDCSGCVENMSNEKGSSDEDSTIYDFEYECLLEEECDDNGSEEKAEQQLKKKSTTDASRHKKRSSSICSCCSDTE
ncbi:hypothetical protein T12_8196 [Trichinella patagoniensis]|uniref:Uncharacterized protein n=1 Tax=Trichinella patagoniensis TaxID=990121 RepID=A0A0V0ZR56_9BILA|nr:hypothetical protein T12_8196 [Trichinella patagoniensis]